MTEHGAENLGRLERLLNPRRLNLIVLIGGYIRTNGAAKSKGGRAIADEYCVFRTQEIVGS